MSQITMPCFCCFSRRRQPPRLKLRTVRTHDGYLAGRRLRTFVDGDYQQFVSEIRGPFGLWEYATRPKSLDGSRPICCARFSAQGGRTGGVDQPGTEHAVPALSAAQKALLIRYICASSRSISSAVSSRSPAAALAAACSADFAPGMATGADGWEIT